MSDMDWVWALLKMDSAWSRGFFEVAVKVFLPVRSMMPQNGETGLSTRTTHQATAVGFKLLSILNTFKRTRGALFRFLKREMQKARHCLASR
ncbi:hypothetical protein [Mesorhizobium sp.]|uniref:hypothetical protein n=1 Tax=Mesorhizobium sp. TaxID=1871066 RepID=UPI00257B0B9A|nr:hypothetical protein [Mesorhizobium sp.]